jgi:hypothetical protein
MKPAEIYEKHPDMDAYRVGGFYSPYCLLATEKRFTDGELAAEYWHATSDILDPRNPVDLAVERRQTMERFASLPHFDA